MSQVLTFFINDDVKFKGAFKVDGVEQTPLSATVTIVKSNGTELLAETAATVNGNDVEHIQNDLPEGAYTTYFTADFGDDQRTGAIKFRVVKKDGQQS